MLKTVSYMEDLVHRVLGIEVFDVCIESQNRDYEGFTFCTDFHSFRSRTAKLTPKKAGYFIACWEKNAQSVNQPYSFEQAPDKLIITIFDGHKSGQFVFSKEVLLKHGILHHRNTKGKMAFRVYPDWVVNLNKTAEKTRKWQSEYFIDLTNEVDADRIRKLYL